MTEQTGEQLEKTFSRLAGSVARACGRPWAFALCLLSLVVWGISGPVMHYSETWQLVINTGTTIVTFLMVFLIQNTQNRDGVAVQAKLDELIRSGNAKNDFVGLEHLTAAEIGEVLSKRSRAAKRRRERREAQSRT
ncbi:low affinity iron permease family protein [Mesorhizobium sp. WSM4313]|uniref:low affinity iron permease family protein n=1 Tax=Mesorhizobium sp. WSM4313 TaxID=2029412 RepID=UPI000BAE6ACB|nr:low affinity iron permease family protein [Mesorhizobium sp. WSM4313]PBB16104.1 iron permease [Mesorhizobium sp. WSM4313]